MKKCLVTVLVILPLWALSSCSELLLSSPDVPQAGAAAGSGSRAGMASNLTATHGEKRAITLSWEGDPAASRYNIYQAASPLDQFVQSAETADTVFKFTVPAGSTVYYKVCSVSADGTLSSPTDYVMGTSLAQPVISDITDIKENKSTVAWYMENVSDDTYREALLYTVFCYTGSKEIAQQVLEAKDLAENKVVFENLNANTNYQYQVEAYTRGKQDESEKSDFLDAATARRMRPGAPVNLTVSRGTKSNVVEVSFVLPETVDIARGNNEYDPYPLYFVISKRFYREDRSGVYDKVCSYYGTDAAKKQSIGGSADTFETYYEPGAKVTWTDRRVQRGVEYEYMVQAYVDGTPNAITSDSSKASGSGWALSVGTLTIGNPDYTLDAAQDEYAGAELPLAFSFDAKGEAYKYTLIERIDPVGDGSNKDPAARITRTITPDFTSVEAVSEWKETMHFAEKTTESYTGRGVYSFKVEIKLPDGTLVDEHVETLGGMQVSEDTHPLVVENFRVQDGYADRFVISFTRYQNLKYEIYTADQANMEQNNWGQSIAAYPLGDLTSSSSTATFTYDNQNPGVTRYFAIRPFNDAGKRGQMVYASGSYKTLGIPSLSLGEGYSYSTITAIWSPVEKADVYRVKYKYEGDSVWLEEPLKPIAEFTPNVNGDLTFALRPSGYDDVTRAGTEIQVMVEALNSADVTVAVPSTEDVRKRLVGPAELGAAVTQGVSGAEIELSWNKISGADGYYVFRRKFNMVNAEQEGDTALAYYVPAAGAGVTGKEMKIDSGMKVDASQVEAAVSLQADRYTLKDRYMSDASRGQSALIPQYRDEQNDMAQGFPYRYYIVPVIGAESVSSIEFEYNTGGADNKNTSIKSCTIRDVTYGADAAALERTGFLLGFGYNVTASKGTYDGDGDSVNDGIRIEWEAPPLLAGTAGLQYTLYRKKHSEESVWDVVDTSIDALSYIDGGSMTEGDRGHAFEYLVGITQGNIVTDPRTSSRFIDRCRTSTDDRNRVHMLGFMLKSVPLSSVSRDAQPQVGGEYPELVKWYSGGVENLAVNDLTYGIDGYEIQVMNRQIDGNWHTIAGDVPVTPNQQYQQKSVTNTNNLLKVLRDYKHYFRVLSYVINANGDKVFCPEPVYTWSDGFQTDYVKWGARQISANEFAAITALGIGTGMNKRGSYGVSLSESNVGYNRDINFNNSKPQFVTINGHLYGFCNATAMTPTEYGADCNGPFGALSGGKNHESTLTVTGPSDVTGLYSGSVKILRMSDSAGTGPYKVTYNGNTDFAVENKYYRECFTFKATSNNYKNCDGLDWNPNTGWW